jgi:hypothetical protein
MTSSKQPCILELLKLLATIQPVQLPRVPKPSRGEIMELVKGTQPHASWPPPAGLLSDVREKVETGGRIMAWADSLSPEMRRFHGLPPRKRGRKKDAENIDRFSAILQLRQAGATWPATERAISERFGEAANGTHRRFFEREVARLRGGDKELLAIFARLRGKPGRPRKNWT